MDKQPHIIFIFSDQQHWQALQSEDDSFSTPHLQSLLEDGTQFTQAFCTTPQCSPSRSSMLTGRYPSKTGVLGNVGAAGGGELEMNTIGKHLQDAGYQTAYYGKWHLGQQESGCAGWHDHYFQVNDHEVEKRAVAFIERMGQQEKPCALFLSFNN
ncbi:MAG: sulfatase-like hydrolase/transferase, partial [Planctomycetes bacterium]|nr:sulfatase-like hydrolase/transferase [Planctomycetota bacterium]